MKHTSDLPPEFDAVLAARKVFEQALEDIVDHAPAVSGGGQVLDRKIISNLLNATGREYVTVEKILDTLTKHQDNLAQLFTLAGAPSGIRRLVIAPCSDYIQDLIPVFQKAFDAVVLCDGYKQGTLVGGLEVQDAELLSEMYSEGTVLFIPTTREEVVEIYQNRFPTDHSITVSELMGTPYLLERDSAKRQGALTALDTLARQIAVTEKPIVIISGTFMATWEPMVEKLRDAGRSVFWVGRHDLKDPGGYSNLPTRSVPVDGYAILSMPEILILLAKCQGVQYLINTEAFYYPNWDGARAVLCYAFGYAFSRLVQRLSGGTSKAVLFLYDPIKPVNVNVHFSAVADYYYEQMVQAADGVIFNSCTDDISSFLSNAFDLSTPMVHFFRYSVAPTKVRARRRTSNDGEKHICCISAVLDEFHEPSRSAIRPYIRQLIEQRIHFHYYGDAKMYPRILEFADELPKELKGYFHHYDVIREQQDLVNEIQQYDAGWVVHDQQVFWRIVAACDSQLSRDIFQLFPMATIPTSAMTYGAAGLPIIINRCMRGTIKQFPEECVLPIELSEIRNLKGYMAKSDWDERLAVAKSSRHLFTADHHMHRLTAFLEAV